MAVNRNDNVSDSDPPRDPRLARLLAAGGGEAPPAALDAAILAAARREVSARPQGVGGGGVVATPVPAARAKRNWYVPVSIAAVLVMSVSLVTLVHEQKGDELTQPSPASVPGAPSAPQADAEKPAPAAAPAPDKPEAVPATPKRTETTRGDVSAVKPAPEAPADLANKPRLEQSAPAADGAPAAIGRLLKDAEPPASSVMREQAPVPSVAVAPQAVTPPPAPPASTGEIKAAEPFPAQAGRDALEVRQRNEADRSARALVAEAPMAAVAPPPAAPPRRAAAAPVAEPQMAPPPPVVAAKPMAASPAARMAEKRALPWRGLEEQPPERWLERLAEFKRDGRAVEADELMVEFRRRFPEHPASVR